MAWAGGSALVPFAGGRVASAESPPATRPRTIRLRFHHDNFGMAQSFTVGGGRPGVSSGRRRSSWGRSDTGLSKVPRPPDELHRQVQVLQHLVEAVPDREVGIAGIVLGQGLVQGHDRQVAAGWVRSQSSGLPSSPTSRAPVRASHRASAGSDRPRSIRRRRAGPARPTPPGPGWTTSRRIRARAGPSPSWRSAERQIRRRVGVEARTRRRPCAIGRYHVAPAGGAPAGPAVVGPCRRQLGARDSSWWQEKQEYSANSGQGAVESSWRATGRPAIARRSSDASGGDDLAEGPDLGLVVGVPGLVVVDPPVLGELGELAAVLEVEPGVAGGDQVVVDLGRSPSRRGTRRRLRPRASEVLGRRQPEVARLLPLATAPCHQYSVVRDEPLARPRRGTPRSPTPSARANGRPRARRSSGVVAPGGRGSAGRGRSRSAGAVFEARRSASGGSSG